MFKVNSEPIESLPSHCERIGHITIDWRDYFRRFCEKHGEPVLHDGWQLFPDGWQYSAHDYKGPEIQPPDDPRQLLLLKSAYWQIRRDQLLPLVTRAKQHLDAIQDQRTHRSAPLPEEWITEAVNAWSVRCEMLAEIDRELESLRLARLALEAT